MGSSKTSLFTQEQNDLADVAKALAHPARIAILEHLIAAEECINGDLVEELGLAQATVSQHLRELKRAGLIQGTIEGTSVCYCIRPERWQAVNEQLQAFFGGYTHTLNDNCC